MYTYVNTSAEAGCVQVAYQKSPYALKYERYGEIRGEVTGVFLTGVHAQRSYSGTVRLLAEHVQPFAVNRIPYSYLRGTQILQYSYITRSSRNAKMINLHGTVGGYTKVRMV